MGWVAGPGAVGMCFDGRRHQGGCLWRSHRGCPWGSTYQGGNRELSPCERQTASMRNEHELEWSIFGLLPLYDGLNDRESLKSLVDLEAYYLGEAPGEVLDCLLVRKGESVVSILAELKRTGSQICRHQLGPKSTVCRSDDEIRREVDILIKRINGKELCDVEQ